MRLCTASHTAKSMYWPTVMEVEALPIGICRLLSVYVYMPVYLLSLVIIVALLYVALVYMYVYLYLR